MGAGWTCSSSGPTRGGPPGDVRWTADPGVVSHRPAMMLLTVAAAHAHETGSFHSHGTPPILLVVLAGWLVAGAVWLRRTAR